MRRAIGSAVLVCALTTPGCTRAPVLPSGYTEEAARAFQVEHDADVSAPDGPLAAVASHYVGVGQSLRVGIVEGALVVDPPAGADELRVSMDDGGARCEQGCGQGSVAIDAPRRVSFGRFTLSMSLQSGALRIVVLDPEAPARVSFDGLPWFPVDPSLIVAGRFEADDERPSVDLSTSRGLQKAFVRAGVVRAAMPGGTTVELTAFSSALGQPMLIPLTDETTGESTYPVGRYLEVDPPLDGVVALDFNRLTNPWCAYSEHYNCPIPPAGNAVNLPLRAGEQYAAHGEHDGE